MEIKADKQHFIKRTISAVVAASIILGSFITVVAAAQQSDTNLYSTNAEVKKSKIEFELPNGDMMVGHTANLDVSVNVLKAYSVIINDHGKKQTVMLAKGSVADALKKAEISVDDNSVSVPSEETQITGNTVINILDAKNIKVTADGVCHSVKVPSGNVVSSLNQCGFNVSKDDMLNISKDSDVMESMNIKISRVRYGEETVSENVSYNKTSENSDKVELGSTQIGTKGQNGKKLVTKKCKYVDGKKVKEQVVKSKVTKKPVTQVTLIGTKGAASSGGAGTFTDSNGAKIAYSQVLTGSGTAYTAPAGAGTATGVTAYHGGVAVNPNIIPYGSKLYIVSTDGSFVYGYATAVDTGGALMDGSAIVDCFYNTYGECVNFGRRNVKVYVIK